MAEEVGMHRICSVFSMGLLFIAMHTVGESQVVHHFMFSFCYKNARKQRLEMVCLQKKIVCLMALGPGVGAV